MKLDIYKLLFGDVVDETEAGVLCSAWENAKDESYEGRIVAFADFLSVLAYITEELRSSNATMREHLISMREYYQKFCAPEFNFIRPLVQQAGDILHREVLG